MDNSRLSITHPTTSSNPSDTPSLQSIYILTTPLVKLIQKINQKTFPPFLYNSGWMSI